MDDELANYLSNRYVSFLPEFELLNLVPSPEKVGRSVWKQVGNITQNEATVNTIHYIGAEQVPNYVWYHDGTNGQSDPDNQASVVKRPLMSFPSSGMPRFRVATNIAPPFVIESTKLDNDTCLTGDFCLKVCTPWAPCSMLTDRRCLADSHQHQG